MYPHMQHTATQSHFFSYSLQLFLLLMQLSTCLIRSIYCEEMKYTLSFCVDAHKIAIPCYMHIHWPVLVYIPQTADTTVQLL